MAARKFFIKISTIMMLGIFFYGCANTMPPPNTAQEYYESAQNDLRKRRYEEAKYRFEKIYNNYPECDIADNALFKLGYIYIIQKDYASSEKFFRIIVEDYEDSEWKFDAQTWLKLLEDWKRLKNELENAREQLGIAKKQAETSDRTENDTAERIQELQDEVSRLRDENNNLRMLIENLEE